MQGTVVNINTSALVALTAKLERLHRSALPVAVRQTLTSAAYNLKQRTLLQTTDALFTKRKPSFWRAKSRVFPARGFNISSMQAVAGFVGNSQAVEDLNQQQRGGTIEGRSYVAMDTARVSKNEKRSVRAKDRLKNMRIVDARKSKGNSEAAKFIRALHVAGVGGLVLADYNGKTTLWRVNNTKKKRDGTYNITPLYSYQKGRSVKVKPTAFMTQAAAKASIQIPQHYKTHAQRQFTKALR